MNFHDARERIQKVPRRLAVLIALLGIVVVVFIIPKGNEKKEDWSLLRLNEIKAGKTPAVLFLSGSFAEKWKSATGSPAPKSGEFEMYIRGANFYFLKCWNGNPTNRSGPIIGLIARFLPFIASRYSGWWYAQIAVEDFNWKTVQRWGGFGAQGGGGSGDSFAPGRQLWNQSGFIGALEQGQVNKEWYATETYKSLMKIGAYRIPRIIEFDQRGYSQTFRIKKCGFRDAPKPDWFIARMREYCPHYDEIVEKAGINSSPARY